MQGNPATLLEQQSKPLWLLAREKVIEAEVGDNYEPAAAADCNTELTEVIAERANLEGSDLYGV